MLADAEHTAMASVARVDVLVSWNFRHIVNLQRIRDYHVRALHSTSGRIMGRSRVSAIVGRIWNIC